MVSSTASNGPLEIKGGLSPWLASEIRSNERKFQIDAFEREPGKWRASIRRSDGAKLRAGDMGCDLFTTSVDTSTAELSWRNPVTNGVHDLTVPVLLVGFTSIFGTRFLSGFLSPFRWCYYFARSLINAPAEIGTYLLRNRSWKLLLAMAMGLEGYRYSMPLIKQFPSFAPHNFAKYENMPPGAEERALERRSAWIAHHLGDVSETFSKLAITAADISSLLRIVEEDQTLVHSGYYADDECIALIADWIAGRELLVGAPDAMDGSSTGSAMDVGLLELNDVPGRGRAANQTAHP